MPRKTLDNDPELLELMIRNDRDPIKNYQPFPTQKRCYASKARYRYIGGANRRGKTAHLCVELVASALRIHPNKTTLKNVTFLVLAPSREQLQDPWAKKLLDDCELPGFSGRPFLPSWEVKKVYYTHGAGKPTIRQIDLVNGNIIKFGVSKDVEGWKRKAGTQLFCILLDEGEGDENMVAELYPRLLDANKDPQIVKEAGGGWILWGATRTTQNQALTRFIENCESDDPACKDWEAFHFTDEDGTEIDKLERERMRSAFSGDDFDVRMSGKARYEDRLLIYAHLWDDERHLAKEDYVIKDDDNIWCAYDPGGAGKESHNSGLLFAAINKEEPTKLRMVKGILLNKTTLAYDMKRVAHFLQGRTLHGFVYDIACHKTDKGTGKSLDWQIKEQLLNDGVKVRRFMPCYNRHDPGIKRCQTYLEEGLIQLNPSKESGCLLLRGEILAYKSYEAGVYTGERGVVKVRDELVDCWRYIVNAINAGRNRLCWMPKPCGPTTNKYLPEPPIERPMEVLTVDQQNFKMQMERSARMAKYSVRPRMLN